VIVRILGEGQYDVSDEAITALNGLDARVEACVESGDEAEFHTALAALLDGVRTSGTPIGPDSLEPSDLILPMADASLAEVRDMLSGDGLIPG